MPIFKAGTLNINYLYILYCRRKRQCEQTQRNIACSGTLEEDTECAITRGDTQNAQQQTDTTYFGEASASYVPNTEVTDSRSVRGTQSHLNSTDHADLSSTPLHPPPPTLATSLSGIGLPYQIPRPSMVSSAFATDSSRNIPAPTRPYPSEFNYGNYIMMFL